MLNYLIESAVCMAVLFICYTLVLSKVRFFKFNRFYLLFSIPVSLILPLLSFKTGIQSMALLTYESGIGQNISGIAFFSENIQNGGAMPESQTSFWKISNIALLIYSTVSLLLLFRFSNNLIRLIRQMRNNTVVHYHGNKIVLLNSITSPCAFLQTIFLSSQDYQNELIDQDLLNHEIAHKTQLHSIDVIFIELVQIVLWFNPLIYFYKSAVNLNHEYLADDYSAEQVDKRADYSNKLISYTYNLNSAPLASGLRSQLTRKRLLMIHSTVSNTYKMVRFSLLFMMVGLLTVFISCENEKGSSLLNAKVAETYRADKRSGISDSVFMKNDLKMTISFDTVRQVDTALPIYNFKNILNVSEPDMKLLFKEVITRDGLDVGVKKLLDDQNVITHLTFAEVNEKLLMIKCQYDYSDEKKYDSMILEFALSLIKLD